MSNTADILSYVESLANSQLDGSSLRAIDSKIGSTHRKMRDSKLYLALVGEFSSGKSTFINALLGFRLLKEAVMPTTASATYIQSGGKTLTVDAVFFDGKKFHSTSDDFGAVADYLHSKYKRNHTSLHGVIEDLTSDHTIARSVKDLRITIPNAKIPDNIVLIDTPGFNPGTASADNHYEITRYVVENVADAALVLTPQEQAMSATLIRFLNETLKRCLHRCVFVVTKVDNLPSGHRSSVMQYVQKRIVDDLNVPAPQLYAESAITMLPVKKIPSDRQQDWIYFQSEFKRFERAIWENLQRSRDVVLKEHVNILVQDIVVLCSQKVRERENAAKKDREFIENHRVESIQNVCEMMVSQSTSAISAALGGLNISFRTAENNSKSRSDSIIDDGTISVSRFRDDMMPSISRAVDEEAKKRLSVIDRELNSKVRQCANAQIDRMRQVFASHYDSFPALRPTESIPKADLIRFHTPEMSFSMAMSKIEELDKKENRSAGIGAVAGGVLGFIVGGPFGAVAGALIGGGGGVVANDQTSNMRSEAKPLVRNEIASFFASLRSRVEDEKRVIMSRYSDLIRHFAEDHVRKYGKAVDQLIARQKEEIALIDRQIKSLKSTLITLNEIQCDLEQELTILKIKY